MSCRCANVEQLGDTARMILLRASRFVAQRKNVPVARRYMELAQKIPGATSDLCARPDSWRQMGNFKMRYSYFATLRIRKISRRS